MNWNIGTGIGIMEEKLANPAPLGLLGFGMTTVLLSLHNAGLYDLNSMILAMALVYGGFVQIIAGAMEYKKGSTFGTVAFSSYGLLWLSLVFLLIFPKIGLAASTSAHALAWYFMVWGTFTLCMFFSTLNKNRALQFIFLSATILFGLLAIRDFTYPKPIYATIGTIAGWEGVICGASAIYLAIAEITNETYGREVLPICPVKAKAAEPAKK